MTIGSSLSEMKPSLETSQQEFYVQILFLDLNSSPLNHIYWKFSGWLLTGLLKTILLMNRSLSKHHNQRTSSLLMFLLLASCRRDQNSLLNSRQRSDTSTAIYLLFPTASPSRSSVLVGHYGPLNFRVAGFSKSRPRLSPITLSNVILGTITSRYASLERAPFCECPFPGCECSLFAVIKWDRGSVSESILLYSEFCPGAPTLKLTFHYYNHLGDSLSFPLSSSELAYWSGSSQLDRTHPDKWHEKVFPHLFEMT